MLPQTQTATVRIGQRELIAGFTINRAEAERRRLYDLGAITLSRASTALWELPLHGVVPKALLQSELLEEYKGLPPGIIHIGDEGVERLATYPVRLNWLMSVRKSAACALGSFVDCWAPYKIAVSKESASARQAFTARRLGIGFNADQRWVAFPRELRPATFTPSLWLQSELIFDAWLKKASS